MAQLARQQDLPPPGGYKPIPFARIPAKKHFGGLTAFATFIACTAGGMYLFALNRWSVDRSRIEMRSSKMAILPMLLAERDRAFLKQLRINRDAEEELMKDVEGWVVGTWYGEPVYRTIPPGTFVPPTFHEYYAHSSEEAFVKRCGVKWNS